MESVSASLIHLVRHGEVHNPDGILYGRIPGYHLSELGSRMAAAAAASMALRPVAALYSSPLQRAQESASSWAAGFRLDVHTDDRLIEPWNRFEGDKSDFGLSLLKRPLTWPWLVNPFRPSWGEPYVEIASRMIAAMDQAWAAADDGEVVLVGHQLPIVMVQRAVAGRHLFHDPRQRRCSLSSITTFARRESAASGEPRYVEVDYQEPAAELLAQAKDEGAV